MKIIIYSIIVLIAVSGTGFAYAYSGNIDQEPYQLLEPINSPKPDVPTDPGGGNLQNQIIFQMYLMS